MASATSHFTPANSAGAFSISAAAKLYVASNPKSVAGPQIKQLIGKVNTFVHLGYRTALFTNYEQPAAMLLC